MIIFQIRIQIFHTLFWSYWSSTTSSALTSPTSPIGAGTTTTTTSASHTPTPSSCRSAYPNSNLFTRNLTGHNVCAFSILLEVIRLQETSLDLHKLQDHCSISLPNWLCQEPCSHIDCSWQQFQWYIFTSSNLSSSFRYPKPGAIPEWLVHSILYKLLSDRNSKTL